jgi:hypothetical protein
VNKVGRKRKTVKVYAYINYVVPDSAAPGGKRSFPTVVPITLARGGK